MNLTIPGNWKQVTPELFKEFLEVCNDYRTDGWANGIVYYFLHNREKFAFEVDAPKAILMDPQFLL